MKTVTTNILSGLIFVVVVVLGILWHPHLPALVASHWDAAGHIDGYLSRDWAVWLPILMVGGLWALLASIPVIDPLKHNLAKFRFEYNWLQIGILTFIAAIFLYINYLSVIGRSQEMSLTPILIAVGLLIAGLGWILPYVKRNYFVGIRTPWTLESDTVWNETHRRSGPVFVAAGLLSVLSAFVPAIAIWILLGSTLTAVLYAVILSYVLHRKLLLSKEGKI